MTERPTFEVKKGQPKTEIIEISGIKIVDQMEIPAPKGVSERFRQKINVRACGAALLEMLSEFWCNKGQLGEIIPAQTALYEIFGVGKENFHQGDPDTHIYPVLGCTIEALAKAGKAIGLLGSIYFYEKTPEEILKEVGGGFPLIVEVGARNPAKREYDHWRSPSGKEYWQLTNGHFVLVTGFERNKKTGEYLKIFVADTLNYEWFNHYTLEEFKSAAYIFHKGNRYYWGQGAILKP